MSRGECPRREFLHLDDLADVVVFALECHSAEGRRNVGPGKGVRSLPGWADTLAHRGSSATARAHPVVMTCGNEPQTALTGAAPVQSVGTRANFVFGQAQVSVPAAMACSMRAASTTAAAACSTAACSM